MVPPFVGVAVKVADAPAHSGFVPEVKPIETEGERDELTVIVIPVDVAVAGLTHTALEVITQVTMSPLFKVLVVKVVLFVPAFPPFTFHW